MNRGRLVAITLAVAAVVASALWSWRVVTNPAAVTPALLQLSTFGVAGGQWASAGPSAPLTYYVLPLPAPEKGVLLLLNAPYPSSLTMSAIDTTVPPPMGPVAFGLAEIAAGDPEPTTGYFRVDRVDTAGGLTRWFVTVGPPAAFLLPRPVSRYLIGITNVSHNPLTSGAARTSAPLLITLDTRPDYTVRVRVVGPGHVTSNPSGIHCGRTCESGFGPNPVTVTLNPGSDDPSTTRFLGWGGNCLGGNPCTLNLTGAPANAVATFGPAASPPIDACPVAPLIAGYVWRDKPVCTRPERATRAARCDAGGYFCCDPGGPPDPRCPGTIDTKLTPPDCGIGTDRGTRWTLFQPGGCYERGSGS